jgi:transcriptional regulator of acetoin/glycerol metabolism
MPPQPRIPPRGDPASRGSHGHALRNLVTARERELILAALGASDWNVSRSARDLGLSRVGLYKAMRRLGIRRP